MSYSSQASFQRALHWILQLAISGWAGIWLGNWLVDTQLLPALAVLLLAFVFLIAIVVHEAGHWLGSYFARLRCYAISILWLHLERQGSRWRLSLGKRRPGVNGYVKAMPVKDGNLTRQMAIFVAAGPAISLLAGLLALGAGRQLSAVTYTTQVSLFFSEGLWLFGWWSLLIGLKNLVPFTTAAGTGSDGKMLYQLYRGGPAIVQQHATLRLNAASYQGVRPRDWDASLLAVLLDVPAQSVLACSAHTYAYMHHLDTANLATARHHLAVALEGRGVASPQLQQILCCEAAYLALIHDRDFATTTEWLAAAEKARPLSKEQRHFT
jgi:hypothetical protein